MIVTKKIPLNKKEEITFYNYFLESNYCYYIANDKGVSIEAFADKLITSKNIMVFFYKSYIYIIFTNFLEATIIFPFEVDYFNWNKLNSTLKTLMIKHNLEKIYISENNILIENIEVPYIITKKRKIKKYIKKTKSLINKRTFYFKIISFFLFIILLFLIQNKIFNNLNDKELQNFLQQKQEIRNKTRFQEKKIRQYKKMIKELPSKVAKNYKDIVKDKNFFLDLEGYK